MEKIQSVIRYCHECKHLYKFINSERITDSKLAFICLQSPQLILLTNGDSMKKIDIPENCPLEDYNDK